MPESPQFEKDFLGQLTDIVENNLANEQFGVSDLADRMSMSRSNLLRRVKKETNLSVSQLISQVRLKRGMELLRTTSLNVSEVSHRVGFGSTSYFIKCFREYYGYPPGEVGQHDEASPAPEKAFVDPVVRTPAHKQRYFLPAALAILALIAIGLIYFTFPKTKTRGVEKSIAVLPFINDSNDSTNVYLINGLMESTLNNLHQIEDIRVVSRTSSETYRNTQKSIPEISKELGVNYLVEGSGQKIGDHIVLNIQLVEGPTDRHIWSKQYRKEVKDIFDLQQEIAQNIAGEIQVAISPEEAKKIKKKPTENLLAYDYFLKGRDLFYKATHESLQESIPYFKKAIQEDSEFALAYANAAMVYYYLDVFQKVKEFDIEISTCAENAMKYDPHSSESLIAKALSYAHSNDYATAVGFLEQALEANSNSGLAIHFLTEFYNWHVPNTAKYLEYALMGVKLEIASSDSTTASFKYLHLSNALMQSGFVDEGIKYIDKALAMDSSNKIAAYARVWFLFLKNKDENEAKTLMLQQLEEDTARIDVLQEVGKLFYLLRDYETAYKYYKKFLALREDGKLDIFKNENLKMAIVFEKMGETKKADELFNSYLEYAENDKSIYRDIQLAVYYAYMKKTDKVIEHLRRFSQRENFAYWVLFYEMDTAFDSMNTNPEFRKVTDEIKAKFWQNHKKIRASLEEKRLI